MLPLSTQVADEATEKRSILGSLRRARNKWLWDNKVESYLINCYLVIKVLQECAIKKKKKKKNEKNEKNSKFQATLFFSHFDKKILALTPKKSHFLTFENDHTVIVQYQ